MARISLAPKPTLGYRLVRFVLRRRYGVMLDPVAAAAHQPWGDFGYWASHHAGVDPAELRAVTHWRDSDLYSALERRVMAYPGAMTATPPEVTDQMVAELRVDLRDAEPVELTATVALEDLRNRNNAALGLTGQGFKDRCEVPAP
ncbi:carboxymuconolactone decarboxylase family protein [Jiangella aurantiaca]|uniref:Carboxymuconolactone decarboxylase family protein n=1 Tax=Jiangella aurantiaca TaxID=2530373 RepID=A0A4R5ABG0_9ACTN|nr:carboxymuconolactone decarboxylase family protein [Jiangella aurantiaca]TDD68506.1 carboxymuconolactone decarboxylase family protein [Jiangella aurantiaca]